MIADLPSFCEILPPDGDPANNELVRAWWWAYGVVGGLAFTGCKPAPPCIPAPAGDTRLSNFRTLRRVGDQLIRQFDAERLPRLESALADSTQVEWVVDGQTLSGKTTPLGLDFGVVTPGSGRLRSRTSGQCTEWPVRWDYAPTNRPTIAKLTVALAKQSPAKQVNGWRGAVPKMGPEDRLWGVVELARALARAGDQVGSAEAWLAAADEAKAAGAPTEEARRARAAGYFFYRSHRFVEADRALDQADAVLEAQDNESQTRLSYYRGSLAFFSGRYRDALRHLESALRSAAGDPRLGFETVNVLALLYSELGLHADALSTIGAAFLKNAAVNDDALSRAYVNRGWVRARGLPAGALSVTSKKSRSDYERALMLVGADPGHQQSIRANLVELSLREGNTKLAAVELSEALSAEAGAHRSFLDLLGAELLFQEGKYGAAYTSLEKLADQVDRTAESSPLRWQVHARLAQSAWRLGDLDRAAEAYATALEILDGFGWQAPIHAGRGTYLANRRDVATEAIRLHAQQGQNAAAYEIVTRSQAGVVRAFALDAHLDELGPELRREWMRLQSDYGVARERLAKRRDRCEASPRADQQVCWDQLKTAQGAVQEALDGLASWTEAVQPKRAQTTVRVGSMQLIFWRLSPTEIARFARTAQRIEYATVDPKSLLMGLTLQDFDHIYITSNGVPEAHEIPTQSVIGRPLNAQIGLSTVPYPAWSARRSAAKDLEGGRVMLVVANPARDLAFAEREGRSVGHILNAQPIKPKRAELVERITKAQVFHFAGHGALSADDPWAAHLKLAADERLTLSDVLALRTNARLVVLSGCETGVSRAIGVEAISLPDAFLVAGARSVIATTRVVEDAAALRFIEHFYRVERGHERPGPALRATIAKFHADGDPIWSAFRLWGHP